MSTTQSLQVIFGSGPLGMAVMRSLVKKGFPVRIVNRSGKADAPHEVEVVGGDAMNLDTARTLAKGAAVVYQCAQPPYHKWVDEFPVLHESILQAAISNQAKLILGDNLYAYGEVDGMIHEELPNHPKTRKGKTRARMAKSALEAHSTGKVQVAIARGSDFYGPGVLGSVMGERVFIPALQGKSASAVGSLDLPHTYTYIEDFGQAMAILGERDEALGQIWHVPNPETITQRQFISLIYGELDLTPKMSGMGAFMMRLGGLFIPEARESVEMMYEFEKPFIVDDSKFKRVFGDISTPLGETIRATVAWYRAHILDKA